MLDISVSIARRLLPSAFAAGGASNFHRALSPKPNSAYALGKDGTILFRAHWANDTKALAAGLNAIAAGNPRAEPRAVVWFSPPFGLSLTSHRSRPSRRWCFWRNVAGGTPMAGMAFERFRRLNGGQLPQDLQQMWVQFGCS